LTDATNGYFLFLLFPKRFALGLLHKLLATVELGRGVVETGAIPTSVGADDFENKTKKKSKEFGEAISTQ
jgi:hypothetical protein